MDSFGFADMPEFVHQLDSLQEKAHDRTVQDAYNEYLPIVLSMVLENEAINAHEYTIQNLRIVCDETIRSVILDEINSSELTKLYFDNSKFHNMLHTDIRRQVEENLRQYRANSLLSQAEEYILPKLAFDEQVDITDEFFNYEAAWHVVSNDISELARRYRNGEDIKIEFAKQMFRSNVNSSEIESLDGTYYEVEITNDENGVDVKCENAEKHFSWEEIGDIHWNYLKDTFKEIQQKRVREYPEVKEDVDRLIANMDSVANSTAADQPPVQTSNMAIADFRAKTAELYNPIGKYSPEDIEDIAKSFAEVVFSDNEIEATVGNVILTGSRSRGLETDRSDIDVVIEVDFLIKEDSLFNVLHEELLDIDGITVDINPIRAEETGTLETYLPSAESYLSQKAQEQSKAEQKQPEADQEQRNFSFSDDFSYASGEKGKYNNNIAAIRTLKRIEDEGRNATPEEQQILSKYAGWGGVSKAFDPDNAGWSKEYAELKELLTPDEYAAAKGSVLNAHFTSPEIINAMYKALGNMGVKEGNILEPSMGVGNFFGCFPEKMKNCQLYGVELDSITGRIARQLYPNAKIQIRGFEQADFPDNYFSAAIGNVPVGDYSVADKQYDKHHFLVHDYFFAKALDKVAPNGIVAFVTSKGTLDKQNSKVREHLAQHADLVGAIRLPNNTFKGSANTEVTSDIIFLQKREKATVEMPDWVYLGENAEGIPINQYFVDNPDMVLGKMERTTGRYGEDIVCSPIEGEILSEQLDKAVSKLKTDVAVKARSAAQSKENGVIPATDDVRNFTYAIVEGKLYYRENSQ